MHGFLQLIQAWQDCGRKKPTAQLFLGASNTPGGKQFQRGVMASG
jgi:hypothetical protein